MTFCFSEWFLNTPFTSTHLIASFNMVYKSADICRWRHSNTHLADFLFVFKGKIHTKYLGKHFFFWDVLCSYGYICLYNQPYCYCTSIMEFIGEEEENPQKTDHHKQLILTAVEVQNTLLNWDWNECLQWASYWTRMQCSHNKLCCFDFFLTGVQTITEKKQA